MPVINGFKRFERRVIFKRIEDAEDIWVFPRSTSYVNSRNSFKIMMDTLETKGVITRELFNSAFNWRMCSELSRGYFEDDLEDDFGKSVGVYFRRLNADRSVHHYLLEDLEPQARKFIRSCIRHHKTYHGDKPEYN